MNAGRYERTVTELTCSELRLLTCFRVRSIAYPRLLTLIIRKEIIFRVHKEQTRTYQVNEVHVGISCAAFIYGRCHHAVYV